MTRTSRLGVALGVLLLLAAPAAAFLPTSRSGIDCGTWMAPAHHDVEYLTGWPATGPRGHGVPPRPPWPGRAQRRCDDALSTRTLVSLVLAILAMTLLGLQVVARRRHRT